MPVAQLDRVFDYESKGRGFESLRARHIGAKFALLRFSLQEKHPPASLLILSEKSHAAPPLFACKGAQGVLAFCQLFSSYHKKENIRIACAKMLMGRLRRVRFVALFGHAKGQGAELEPGRKSREYGGQLMGAFGFLFPLQPHQNPLEQGGGV